MTSAMIQFQVLKNDLNQSRLLKSSETIELAPGQVEMQIESFGFSANNITYWALGDQFKYWQFFPASDNANDRWGLIPVWGYATVQTSAHRDLPVGERLFGYWPPASRWVLQPTQINRHGLLDGSAHRQSLPAGYNRYQRVPKQEPANQQQEALHMLLFPLHITSFCLAEALTGQDWFGVQQIILTSASSKTALGLAQALATQDQAPAVVGLTSAANQAFVASLGCYAQVLSYEELAQIEADKTAVIVDFSGNGAVLNELHARLGKHMINTWHVGLTHWSQNDMGQAYIRDRSEVFFAPAYIQQCIETWGPEVFNQRSGTFLREAAEATSRWLEVIAVDGLAGLTEPFKAVANGQLPAAQGLVVHL
ncbi:DUF2855 family protein [Marinicella meishanensis]|uniref:DUF2855 family protein n=1 Tax=Marinicella meishanensis TaxID=2873263 RepID=UPI001CBBA1FC|nr:DUF2855 family protein [Marinicella sp. NBU2979]